MNMKANETQVLGKVKMLAVAVSAGMLAISPSHASDLEIYSDATTGGATILMMLDNSGSMDERSIAEDYPNRYWGQDYYGRTVVFRENKPYTIYDDDGKATNTTGTYSLTFQQAYENGKWVKYYDRISRLKMALIPFFENPKSNTNLGANADLTKYKIGLGSFFTRSGTYAESGGKILAPSVALTLSNRINMINQIKAINAETWTPTANALAESGAYMFGTHTYRSGYSTTNDYYSGFSLSNSNTKGTSNYTSPIGTSQCDGYGVYLLTDGVPNYAFNDITPNMMNQSLAGSSSTVNSNCPGTYSGGIGGQGWNCIGQYAQILNSKNNPKKVTIQTAAVGFGKEFSALASTKKISRTLTKADGTTESVQVYDCASVTNNDARNLCLIGEKSYGYGEGGFYYAQSDADIALSLKTFINDVGSKELPSVATGTMSVPLDAINLQRSRGYAYLPIIDPKPGVSDLWNGNLKKYYVYNGTIVDGSMAVNTNNTVKTAGKPVIKNAQGEFANNTFDLWNSDKTVDAAKPQVGGTYSNILENKGVNSFTEDTRNLFVNTDNTLTSVKVDSATKKPIGFTALRAKLSADQDSIIGNVLNFLGYPSQAGTIDDKVTITGTFDKSLKKLGGVLHSLPQLVTHEVTLKSDGTFDLASRKDSILYGSMDGAVHFVDDANGKELFTFIPKEILELQANALKGGSSKAGSYPHGVDAPWHVYNNYALTSTGTGTSKVTQYKSLQSFATGGLRMGGSTYYSLNITNKTQPQMLYSVGSNYANVLAGTATSVQGMQNGVLGTTGDQAAFARMGQSWGKPSVGFVKSGGKKVMVNFLPGGYDTCYEDKTFKLNSTAMTDTKCNGKTEAQGNAVYMVKVGEEVTDSTTKAVNIKTDATTSGKLLWWATQGAGTTGDTSRASSLQKSVHQDLNHSIVTEIRAIDRNYDGLTDHIYFADLGGRVWRADINNNKDTSDFKVDRVVKLLDVSDQVGGTDAAPRFYERPLFTVTNEVDGGSLSGVITIGTGNRSQPVSDKRTKADAIYTFVDKDVARRDLFCYTDSGCSSVTMNTIGLKVSNLSLMNFTTADAKIKSNMISNTSQGWYYPLTTWVKADGTTEAVSGLKTFNEPDAMSGLLFTTTYNPNVTTAGQTCGAGIVGQTQRTLMCLPFGNCANVVIDANKDGKPDDTSSFYTKRSTSMTGIGIVDNILAQSSPWDTSRKNTDGSLDKNGKLFGTLCTSGECKKEEYIPSPNPNIDKVGTDMNRLINPRDWWEK